MPIRSILAVILVLVAIPVAIPFAIVSSALSARRLRRAAGSMSCPECSEPLGAESLALADKAWTTHVATLRRLNPGIRLRLVRWVDAVCPRCCVQLRFDASAGLFVKTSQVLQGFPSSEESGAR